MAYLKSTTAYIYDKLNAPIGTKMVFNQTTSPLGWTKETGADDVALRLVSGSVGTGGSVAFVTALASHTPTISQPTASSGGVSNHTLTYSEQEEFAKRPASPYRSTSYEAGSDTHIGLTSNGGYTHGGGHSHGFTNQTISQPTSSAINLDVSYVDVMIATKD